MKKLKGLKQAHTPATKFGSGDFYGTCIKNNICRTVENQIEMPVPKGKLRNPPKSLA